MRTALKGNQVAAYYPYTLRELKAPYYEDPAIEDLYRVESELNRVGKTRVEGKLRPIRQSVKQRIALADYNMDTVNWETVRMTDGAAPPQEQPQQQQQGHGRRQVDRHPQLIALVKEEVE